MNRRCPHCGADNQEELPFCNRCGEPIDEKLQLIMKLEKDLAAHPYKKVYREYEEEELPFEEDDEETEEERKFLLPVVIFGLAAAAVVWLLLK